MSELKKSPYWKHVEAWKHCERCPLHEDRTKVCMARGKVPADVVFVGEAPGQSEDVLGLPFVGPAGQLLDQIIEAALGGDQLRIAFYSAVSCFPAEAKETSNHEPPSEAIKACAPKLKEFIRIAQPRLIVRVGKTAGKAIIGVSQFRKDRQPEEPEWIKPGERLILVDIVHPAAILRAPLAQRGLMVQKCEVVLRKAFNELLIPF